MLAKFTLGEHVKHKTGAGTPTLITLKEGDLATSAAECQIEMILYLSR